MNILWLISCQYDGYETFSEQPPSVSVSFGVGGSMDPPQEGDETDGSIHGMDGLALMEHLGLGEGTRVVDLQVIAFLPRN